MWTSPRVVIQPATLPLFGGELAVFPRHACFIVLGNVASPPDAPPGLIRLGDVVVAVCSQDFSLRTLPSQRFLWEICLPSSLLSRSS